MPDKIEVPYDKYLRETLAAMTDAGVLLATLGKADRPNLMTIGWGAIGSIWGKPVFTILVRPTRYTYRLLAENGDFTVNVLPLELQEALTICGKVSGGAADKFALAKLTALPGKLVRAPIVAESTIAYECRTVMTNEVLPDRLERRIRDAAYASGDFHRIYFGEILCTRASAAVVGAQ